MSRRPCTFKQRDLTKAVRAIVAAGVQVDRVEIDAAGKIVVVTANAGESIRGSKNEWDTV